MKRISFILLLILFYFSGKGSNFAADQTHACSPAIITFTEGGNGVYWDWNFGDGEIGTGNPCTHIYMKEGVFTVTCIITYADFSKDTIQKQNYITVTQFKASYIVSDSVLCSPGENITFTGTGCETYNYKWDFGDGTQTEGMSVSHIYNQPGRYTIKAIALCSCKRTDTLIKQDAIWVFDSLSPEIKIYDTIINSPYDTVVFVNKTHKNISCDSGLSDVVWDFGDSTTFKKGDSVSHCYGKYGTFFVTAWFNSRFGCPQTVFNQTIQLIQGNDIPKIFDDENIDIFPNPAHNIIHVTTLNSTINNIKIVDLQGKILINSTTALDIDIQHLANGIYFMQIFTPNNILTKKFIKH